VFDEDLEGELNPKKIGEFGYCLINIACFWIFDVLPISVTALLPYILFPSLGLMSSGAVAAKYMSNTNLLLVGGFMIAIAIEETGLHQRIALGALKLVGSNPRCLMFGFMMVTWILSMCIANTSTAALMVPIVLSVLEELHKGEQQQLEGGFTNGLEDTIIITNDTVELNSNEVTSNRDDDQETSFHNGALREKPRLSDDAVNVIDSRDIPQKGEKKISGYEPDAVDESATRGSKLDVGLLLCIPFACSIGGVGTLTGTDLNLYLAGFHADMYKTYKEVTPDGNTIELWTNNGTDGYMDITYSNWAMFTLLPSLLIVLLAYVWMQSFYVGFNPKDWFKCLPKRM